MTIDSDAFRSAMGRFASGVTVVTTCAPDKTDYGMTASAFCSVSLDPPLILVCVEKVATLHDAIVSCSHFAVNVLAHNQEQLARRFAEVEGNRFEGIGFSRGVQSMPIIDDALAVLECKRVKTYDGGDHTIVVGEVEIAAWRDDKPLLYYRGGYAGIER
ncbi:MAG: flavin reductase family protein [Gemmatimonadaceae bacterium]|nr:flavin reductase family protein [Gemmatimonadaceae bacterium]